MSHRDAPGGRIPRDCSDFLESIIYLLDDELDESDVRAVQAHLEACVPCLESYDLQRTVKALVARSCPESAPESLRKRVLFSIHSVHVKVTDR